MNIENAPEINGLLRSHMIRLPNEIRDASGIKVFGKKIKSFVFTTDVAIIRNTNADAVIAVYPFTPQPIITQSIVNAADIPVFCGVGGGLTSGRRVINLALDAEFKGAMGVVVNSPISNEVLKKMRDTIDIPIIVTIISEFEDFESRIKTGASILNISGARNTVAIVKKIRKSYAEFPIIATGGPDVKSIIETIQAGANAIIYTPPTASGIMNEIMKKYRTKYQVEN